MTIVPLQFRPGIDRRSTSYGAQGTWFDGNRVRFYQGVPQPIGGWAKFLNTQYVGACRSLLAWTTLSNVRYVGLGTSKKYYVGSTSSLTDVTPIRRTVTLGSNPLAVTSGVAEITVTDANHGAAIGDYVTISGATTFGGIPVGEINKEVVVTAVPSTSTWKFATTTQATSTTTGGGASVQAAYQVGIGPDSTVYGTGWGAGTWGRGTWGSAATLSTLSQRLRVWSHDNFGEDVIICPRGGAIYYWDATSPTSRAVELSTLSGASGVPTVAQQVMVSGQRHVIAFGTNPIGSANIDRLTVRWSNVEDPANWTPTDVNEAGSLRVSSGSEIVCALETKEEILIWTESSLHSMRYVGADFIYGITMIGANTNIIGPLAMAAFGDIVIWMGFDHFFVYDGRLSRLDCPVEHHVFSDINGSQRDKCFASVNSSWSEVTFFYCSANSNEIDRYVSYNVVENLWYYGTIARTAWIDRGLYEYPISASTDQYLYYQEYGTTDGSTAPESGLGEYLESAPLELDQGNNFAFVRRIIPDVSFIGSQAGAPEVQITLKGRNYAASAISTGEGGAVASTAIVPVEQHTEYRDIRLRARSVILRVDGTVAGSYWRLGQQRVDLTKDGSKQ